MTACTFGGVDAIARRTATLERYWSIYAAEPSAIPAIVAECFAPDARFESAALPAPLIGHAAITRRILSIRETVRSATVTHDGPVQWSHDTARWCWSWSGPDGDATGTDVARFGGDDRMTVLTVFDGHVPR